MARRGGVVCNLEMKRIFLVYQQIDFAFPFNRQRSFPLANSMEEIQKLLALQPNTYFLTNTRNTQMLDSLENWFLVF